MIAMQRHIDRGRSFERADQFGRDAAGIGHRDPRVNADHRHMIDGVQGVDNSGQTARRQNKRIAARQNYLPDCFMVAYIGDRRFQRVAAQHPVADHLPPEAKPAIDRAGVDWRQQNPVGITLDNAFDGRVGAVADWIAQFVRRNNRFRQIRHELSGDGIVRVRAVDQPRHMRRNRDRQVPGDGIDGRAIARRDQSRVAQIAGRTERSCQQALDKISDHIHGVPLAE